MTETRDNILVGDGVFSMPPLVNQWPPMTSGSWDDRNSLRVPDTARNIGVANKNIVAKGGDR